MTNRTHDDDDDAPNEILRAVRDAKACAAAAARSATAATRSWPLARIGLGVGIGSAAVAAALLFANRSKATRPLVEEQMDRLTEDAGG